MFDPTDDNLEIFREGDAAVMPGAPTGGEYGEVPVGDYGALPHHLPKMFSVFNLSLPAGTGRTLDVGDRPDLWIVSQDATASAITSIWLAEVPAGPKTTLGPTGTAKLAGISTFLRVEATGSATSTVTVIAVRGYDNIDITPGGASVTATFTTGVQAPAGSLSVVMATGGALTDRSGTIAAGGTRQQAAASNATRRFLLIQNPTTATESLWVNFGTNAVIGSPSIEIGPGDVWEPAGTYMPTGSVDVIAATTGTAYTIKEA